MSGLLAVGYFLFTLIFSLLTFVLWTRMALRYFRISALHPMSQSINKITNPFIMPLTQLYMAIKMRTKNLRLSRYDWPCFSMLVFIELLKFTALNFLFLGAILPWSYIALYSVSDLIVQPCNLLFYAVIARVIMSYVNPYWQHPLADLLRLVTEPLLRLAQRYIPVFSGLDFSPYIIMVLLKVITLFISASLPLHLI